MGDVPGCLGTNMLGFSGRGGAELRERESHRKATSFSIASSSIFGAVCQASFGCK